jgi:hypothetical protein
MTHDVFGETVNILLERKPFRPFTITLADGVRHQVDHPRALAMRERAVVFIGPRGVPHIFDHESVSQVIGELSEQASH